MDRRERVDDIQAAIQAAITGALSSVWTAMPGVVKNVSRLATEQTVATLGRWIRQLDERVESLRAIIDGLQAQQEQQPDEARRAALIRRRDKLRYLQLERDELEGMLEVQVQHMPEAPTAGTVAQRFMLAAMELLPVEQLEAIERRAGLVGL